MISRPQSVKRFYFLDYFYILLKSIEKFSRKDKVFEVFKELKEEYQLGESKYKKLTTETDKNDEIKRNRYPYTYTFSEVIEESLDYNLITKTHNYNLSLAKPGLELLNIYERFGNQEFKKSLLRLMEKKYNAFYYLVQFCYQANSKRNGLLIFPIYSPSKLGFDKKNVKTTNDIVKFSEALSQQLETDVNEYLGKQVRLSQFNKKILDSLKRVKLISKYKNETFNPKNYNIIVKRFRDFWLDFFLRDIYKYKYSLNSFYIWSYRGKQLGILYITEFFPAFNGRVVYPTALVTRQANSDFEKLFDYQTSEKLYIHHPTWDNEEFQNTFVDCLTSAYFSIQKNSRSDFVNLADVRELVCYSLKISELFFNEYLNKAYKMNIAGELKINISLEADKLPQETSAMYLRREPVLINESYKNIISIDLTKGDKQNAKRFR